MALKASIRSLERRVAKAFPPAACNCPWCIVVGRDEPRPPPFCPRCDKQRVVIVVHSDTFNRRSEVEAS
ncbi:MAG: hypothetical protein GIKADHBN_00427 [Phycisphaerales bacterium]|nr:hypothetical protein [Phycisphaerales bacterium]